MHTSTHSTTFWHFSFHCGSSLLRLNPGATCIVRPSLSCHCISWGHWSFFAYKSLADIWGCKQTRILSFVFQLDLWLPVTLLVKQFSQHLVHLHCHDTCVCTAAQGVGDIVKIKIRRTLSIYAPITLLNLRPIQLGEITTNYRFDAWAGFYRDHICISSLRHFLHVGSRYHLSAYLTTGFTTFDAPAKSVVEAYIATRQLYTIFPWSWQLRNLQFAGLCIIHCKSS